MGWKDQCVAALDEEKLFENSEHRTRFLELMDCYGGYPFFTQSDPRSADDGEILLFQLNSVKDIMWGDAGVANFFIDREALKNRDFSHVMYNWDCY